jgi:hypothetical protein
VLVARCGQPAHQLVVLRGVVGLLAVEDDQLGGVGAEPGEGVDRPVPPDLGRGGEAGLLPVQPLQPADQPDLTGQGAGEHGLAEAPDRVGEHGGAVAGHGRDELELGLHDLLEPDPRRVRVEEQQVVLGVVDRRHPDEAVPVADPLQPAELAETGGPGRSGGRSVGGGRHHGVGHGSGSFRARVDNVVM